MVGTKPFLDEIPSYEVRDGCVFITADGFELTMPLRKFRLAMARAAKALAEHDARRGEVVRLPKRKRGGH